MKITNLTNLFFKVSNDLWLRIMKDIFYFVHKPCNLRNDSTLPRQIFWSKKHNFSGPKNTGVLCKIVNAKSLGILFQKNFWGTGKCPLILWYIWYIDNGTLTMYTLFNHALNGSSINIPNVILSSFSNILHYGCEILCNIHFCIFLL